MYKLLSLLWCCMCLSPVSAQITLAWERALGGTNTELLFDIKMTPDSGFVAIGTTNSNDGIFSEARGMNDVFVMRLNKNGQLLWTKNYGGSFEDYGYAIALAPQGGYVFTAVTNSQNGDVVGLKGNSDGWIVRLSETGDILWKKCIGSFSYDNMNFISATPDGGFITAGSANENSGDVTGNKGSLDAWVVKLAANGDIQWQKSYGGANIDFVRTGQPTADGGYVFAGGSNSTDGDIGTDHNGLYDMWVIKIDSIGNLQWSKCFGGSNWEEAWSIKAGLGGEYVVAGQTKSNDGDVSGNHGDYDFWILKLTADGTLRWQTTAGGAADDIALSVNELADGSIIASGRTNSNDGNVSGSHGFYDQWFVGLSPNGQLQWQRCLGGANSEEAYKSILTPDGLVSVGYTSSADGDISENLHYGGLGSECWMHKLTYDQPIVPDLLAFSGEVMSEGIALSWLAPDISNNSYYILEKSIDGFVYDSLTRIVANPLPQVQQFRHIDPNPANGFNHYRLRIYNTDGSFTFSTIVTIVILEDVKFNIYPNPTSENLTVYLNEKGEWDLFIADNLGRIIATTKVTDKITPLQVQDLGNGIYYVYAVKGSTIRQGKFVKIN